MAVAVEGKPTCLHPAVGYGPQHQVPVDFIEAIPGIEECSPKAAVRHIAQAGGISGFAGSVVGMTTIDVPLVAGCGAVTSPPLCSHPADCSHTARTACRLPSIPTCRPAQRLTLPHAVVAPTFVSELRQSTQCLIQIFPHAKGRTPGFLSPANMRDELTVW